MAIVVANPFGVMKGRFAGGIFQNNASGQIYRQYVPPLKSSSQAQRISRNTFKGLNSLWNNLSVARKAGWNSFAQYIYKPLRKTNTGQYRGRSAFFAVYNAVNMSYSKIFSYSLIELPLQDGIETEQTVFSFNYDAPEISVDSYIWNGGAISGPIVFSVSNSYIKSDGNASLWFYWPSLGSGGLTVNNFLDSNSLPFGFQFYISDPYKFEGGKPKNAMKTCIFSQGFWNITAGTVIGAVGCRFDINFSHILRQMKASLIHGQHVLMTTVLLGYNGTLILSSQNDIVIDPP